MKALSSTIERTARELAKLERCSIPTVYRRIQKLKDGGVMISESKTPGKKTGPVPTRYRMVRP